MTRPRTRILTAALLANLALLAGGAHGQDALGAGSALDASPSTRGPLNSPRPSFAAELQFRNAIATGNAPGGLSFRGDLGYRAAGEFTGALGSDTLFSFRRDSLYSGLAGMGIRGTEAVQYQFALTTGARPPSDLMGNLAVSRGFGYGADPQGQYTEPLSINRDAEFEDPTGRALTNFAPDREDGSMLGTLRSSSTYLSTTGMQPILLNVYGEGIEQVPYGVIASNLRGVTTTPLYSNAVAFRKDAMDGAEVTPQSKAYVKTTMNELAKMQIERSIEMLKTKDETDANPDAMGTDSTQEGPGDWFSSRMKEIRAELYGTAGADANDPATQPAETDEEESSSSGMGIDIPDPLDRTIDIEERIRDIENQVESNDPSEKKDALELSPEMLKILRGDSEPINSFVNSDVTSADVYADHIRTGQRLIASERYFDAEERFTRALAIRPGDITAQIGRIHAQIGAGMVLSGSVNLQLVLTAYPQFAATRYSEKLLPASDRIEELIGGLRLRAGVTKINGEVLNEDERIRVSSAILLAYLGYQTLDAESVEQGLGVLSELGSSADKRMAVLLEQIWDVSLVEMESDQTNSAGNASEQESHGADQDE